SALEKSILLLVAGLVLSTVSNAGNDNQGQGITSQEPLVLVQNLSAVAINDDSPGNSIENSPQAQQIIAPERPHEKSLAGWLEQTMSPIAQWIKRWRRLPDAAGSSSVNAGYSQVKTGQWSTGMSEAVSLAQRYYDGVVLSVKRLKAEEETYRIKLLRQSGELQAVDYNKARGQFISVNRGESDADSVD
ncbi:MAG TPA: hypothetical protein VFV48_04635, partial [Pseudomonadales bacterium]|nr:hypothetical protein [Pseudomonadales bacterium]